MTFNGDRTILSDNRMEAISLEAFRILNLHIARAGHVKDQRDTCRARENDIR